MLRSLSLICSGLALVAATAVVATAASAQPAPEILQQLTNGSGDWKPGTIRRGPSGQPIMIASEPDPAEAADPAVEESPATPVVAATVAPPKLAVEVVPAPAPAPVAVVAQVAATAQVQVQAPAPVPVESSLRMLPIVPSVMLDDVMRRLEGGGWIRVGPDMRSAALLDRSAFDTIDPRLLGLAGQQSIVAAWQGAAFDGTRMYFHGGGHKNYGGNEVIALDLPALLGLGQGDIWQRLTEPSPLVETAGSGRCPEPDDGTPAAVHTYDGMIWTPKTGTFFRMTGGGNFCMGAGRQAQEIWEFDPESTTWTLHGNPPTPARLPRAELDPATGDIIFTGGQQAYHYDPVTHEFTRLADRVRPADGVMTIDPVARLVILLGNQNQIQTFPIDGGPHVAADVIGQGTPPFDLRTFGAAYDTKRGVFVMWNGERETFTLDPGTMTFARYGNPTGPAPAARSVAIYSKWAYVAQIDAFVGYSNVDDGVWLYRLPAEPSAPGAEAAPGASAEAAPDTSTETQARRQPRRRQQRRQGGGGGGGQGGAAQGGGDQANAATGGRPGTTRPSRQSPARASDGTVTVDTGPDLLAAVRDAQAGDRIVIVPGTYRLDVRGISALNSGTADAPIVVTAAKLGDVKLEFDAIEGFVVAAPYWIFENLDIQGVCRVHSKCEHAFHVKVGADHTLIRNNRLHEFNAMIKGSRGRDTDGVSVGANDVVIEGNEFFNSTVRSTSNPVTFIDVVGGARWQVRANLLADFAKGMGNGVSYAAFLKGNSSEGLFEGNLVVCERVHSKGTRVGLSFGGGGAGEDTEHKNGIMRNNIVINCNDVGIYLAKASNTKVYNNTLYNTLGLDVRFEPSTADIRNNLITGRIAERNGGKAVAANNVVLDLDAVGPWFVDPAGADFSLVSGAPIVDSGEGMTEVLVDYCGNARTPGASDIGAIEYDLGADCLARIQRHLQWLN